MSQVVLADEINRATPKTQSSLLECMEERQATIDGVTHPMPDPFLVIATQNPIEYEGTFALPEAQLDRFMLRIQPRLPGAAGRDRHPRRAEADPPDRGPDARSARSTSCATSRPSVREIYVDPAVSDYIVRLVSSTRSHPDVYLGASPRGSIALYRASQALAGLLGRDYVIPDDVKALAEPALAHRVIIKTTSSIHDISAAHVVRELVESTPIEAAARQCRRPARGPPEPGRRLTASRPAPPPRPCIARPPEDSTFVFRRLQLLILAVVLIVAAFSTGWDFLFFLVYVGLLVGGGSYILTRLGLADLEAGYAVSQLSGHVGDRLRVTYTLRNTGRLIKPWLEIHNPTTLPGGLPGRALSLRGRQERSWLVRTPLVRRGHFRIEPLQIRTGDPFGFFEASASVGQGITLVVYPKVDALPLWQLPPASIEGARAQPERTLQTTPLATTVRPYAPGDSMNRIHWRTTARTGEIQVKEFDLEQTADAWIFMDLDAAQRGRARRRLDDRGRGPRRRVDRRQGAGREPRGRADRERATG